jgi:Fic family protein
MKEIELEILPTALLADYCQLVNNDVQQKFEDLKDSELSASTFSFYTSVSAVFSSKIEGEAIEMDSYIKHKILGTKFLPDYTQKIDDLYEAYEFAQNQSLEKKTVKQAHTLLTKHILQKSQRGKVRSGMMYVMTPNGKIEYVACDPESVKQEMKKLYNDIAELLRAELSFKESLFFASLIHLVFVKIHPFDDGNGRTARLLEKWFLAQKLGDKAWFIQSEKHCYNQHQTYYTNIRLMGLEYDLLDYSKALPFLLMLPQALFIEN